MRVARLALAVAAAALAPALPGGAAARAIPPAPSDYVLDEAGWLLPSERQALVERLQSWERESSNQLVVAIFRTLDGAELADFNNQVANAWGIGQAGRDNGVLLAVYAAERKIAVEVGYGLEGRITDLVSDLIIRQEITPEFARGRYGAGIRAGVEALIAASRGEYQGIGQTQAERSGRPPGQTLLWIVVIVLLLLGAAGRRRRAWSPIVLGPWVAPYGGALGGPRGLGRARRGAGTGFRIGGSGTFRGGGGGFGGGGARGGW